MSIEMLTGGEARSLEPLLASDVKGAAFTPNDGAVNPFRLVAAYRRAAERRGARFAFHSKVMSIQRDNGRFSIASASGTYTARAVVLACGAWTADVGQLLGLKVPIEPIRGQVLVTELLEPVMTRTLGVMRQTARGEILIGNSKEHVGLDWDTSIEVINDTANLGIRYAPALTNVRIIRAFAGVRPVPVDDLPILGVVPGHKNLYIAVTHSAVTMSPLIGAVIADQVVGREPAIDVSDYSLDRF